MRVSCAVVIAVLAATCTFFSPERSVADPLVAPGDAAVTGFSGVPNPPNGERVDRDGPSLRVIALPGGGPFGLTDASKVFTARAGDIGQVFGVAMDDRSAPDIFAAATAAYGLGLYRPGHGHLRNGAPGAQYTPGQFGPADQGGGPGSIWRIDGQTGAITLFADVAFNGIQDTPASLGGLVFDAHSQQLFVADRATGLIHRFSLDGTDRGIFDHGVQGRQEAGLPPISFDPGTLANIQSPSFDSQNPDSWGFAPAERRVYGLGVAYGRLYYAVAAGSEIWSVGILGNGAFANDAHYETTASSLSPGTEVSQIAFDSRGWMYAAERGAPTGSPDFVEAAESGMNRVLRFEPKQPGDPTRGYWHLAPDIYAIGLHPDFRNADGGVGISCGRNVWSTGERLLDPGDTSPGNFPAIDGLQGNDSDQVEPANMPPLQAWMVNYYDRQADLASRGHMGSLVIRNVCSGGGYAPPPPPEVSCPPGTYWEDGECMLPPICPEDTIWRDGYCVYPHCHYGEFEYRGICHRPPVGCPRDEVYWHDRCIPIGCPPELQHRNGYCGCPRDEVYRDGRCVPPCPPELRDRDGRCQPCPRDENYRDGRCVPPCPPELRDRDGRCHPCPRDEVYRDGRCVPPCENNLRDRDGNCPCPQGERRNSDGFCVPPCPRDEVYRDGHCVPPCSPNDLRTRDNACPCPQGDVRNSDGVCVPPCPRDEVYRDGHCVPPCSPNDLRTRDNNCPCPQGDVRNSDGVCGPPPCPRDEVYRDGRCVKEGCPEGEHRNSDGVCVTEHHCPRDEVYRDGRCVREGCPEGEHRNSDGVCVTEQTCPRDEVYRDGSCVKESCPQGERRNSDGVCVAIHHRPHCGTGEKFVGDHCVTSDESGGRTLVTTPRPRRCREGEHRNSDGVCVSSSSGGKGRTLGLGCSRDQYDASGGCGNGNNSNSNGNSYTGGGPDSGEHKHYHRAPTDSGNGSDSNGNPGIYKYRDENTGNGSGEGDKSNNPNSGRIDKYRGLNSGNDSGGNDSGRNPGLYKYRGYSGSEAGQGDSGRNPSTGSDDKVRHSHSDTGSAGKGTSGDDAGGNTDSGPVHKYHRRHDDKGNGQDNPTDNGNANSDDQHK